MGKLKTIGFSVIVATIAGTVFVQVAVEPKTDASMNPVREHAA